MANARYVSALFNSRDQAHVFHLATNSYAQHMALQGYYDGIIPLADAYVETYQGSRTKKMNGLRRNSRFIKDPKKALSYFMGLRKRIIHMRQLSKQSHLKAIRDDIMALIDQTIYKLKFLK